jgi:hypothetical protein
VRGVLLRCPPGTSCRSKRRAILSLNQTHRRRCRRLSIHHGRMTIPCPRLPFLSPISRHPAHPHAQSQIRRGKGRAHSAARGMLKHSQCLCHLKGMGRAWCPTAYWFELYAGCFGGLEFRASRATWPVCNCYY